MTRGRLNIEKATRKQKDRAIVAIVKYLSYLDPWIEVSRVQRDYETRFNPKTEFDRTALPNTNEGLLHLLESSPALKGKITEVKVNCAQRHDYSVDTYESNDKRYKTPGPFWPGLEYHFKFDEQNVEIWMPQSAVRGLHCAIIGISKRSETPLELNTTDLVYAFNKVLKMPPRIEITSSSLPHNSFYAHWYKHRTDFEEEKKDIIKRNRRYDKNCKISFT